MLDEDGEKICSMTRILYASNYALIQNRILVIVAKQTLSEFEAKPDLRRREETEDIATDNQTGFYIYVTEIANWADEWMKLLMLF